MAYARTALSWEILHAHRDILPPCPRRALDEAEKLSGMRREQLISLYGQPGESDEVVAQRYLRAIRRPAPKGTMKVVFEHFGGVE